METQLVKSGIYSRLFKLCPHTFIERKNIMRIYTVYKKNVNTCICCSAKALKDKLHKIFVLGIGWKVWSSLRLFSPLCPKSIKHCSHLPNPCMPAQQHKGQKCVDNKYKHTHTHIQHTSANSYKDPAHMLRDHFPRPSRSPTVWSTLTLKGKGCLFPSMACHKAHLQSPSSSPENSRAFTPAQPLTHSSFQLLAAWGCRDDPIRGRQTGQAAVPGSPWASWSLMRHSL